MDCSLPGSSVHEILQSRILEWVAISFSRRSLSQFSLCSTIMRGWFTAIRLQCLSENYSAHISFSWEHWCVRITMGNFIWAGEGEKGPAHKDACDEGGCNSATAQRKPDEWAHPPLPTNIFSSLFHGAIKGYSAPRKMPSILIDKEIEHFSLKPLQEKSSEQSGLNRELWQTKMDLSE